MLVQLEKNRRVVKIDSLKNLTISMIDKNKVKFLIVTQREKIDPQFLLTIRQFKNVYPFVQVITVINDYTTNSITSLADAGVNYILDNALNPNVKAAKISAILNEPIKSILPRMQIDNLILDPSKRKVTRSGKLLNLRKREFELLEFLMQNSGRIFSRSDLLTMVWGYKTDTFSNTVDVHILNLRNKIDRGQKVKLIHTAYGKGYKLDK